MPLTQICAFLLSWEGPKGPCSSSGLYVMRKGRLNFHSQPKKHNLREALLIITNHKFVTGELMWP